jgi:WhiB family transcriptional regulator, redox-sensing transcriptional regulator
VPIPLRHHHPDVLPCHVLDPDVFFSRRPADVAIAKAACARCHFRQQCLGRAMRHSEPWGVWGGETFLEGVIVTELRPPGRPPKRRAA